MQKRLGTLLLLLLSCVLMACDDISALKDIVPTFTGDNPNLLVGHWQVASSIQGFFAYDLTLGADNNYILIPQDESDTVAGTYTIAYDHLDLLESSGTVTFSAGFVPDGGEVTMDFSYEASKEKGPQTLKLKCDSFQNEFSFVGR